MTADSPERLMGSPSDGSSAHHSGERCEQALWIRGAWLVPLGLFLAIVAVPSETTTWRVSWVRELGVDLAFTLDGLGRLFLLLAAGVGTAVFYYAPCYLHGHPNLGRLMKLLIAFLLAMTGAVLADDLLVLFLFWEATSVLSFLLVGFDHDKKASRESALHALLITGGGGLALLAGLVLILDAAPGLRMSDLVQLDPAVLAEPGFQVGVALALVGAMTKSAQFPFHFWLPDAMAAPTPVSAYLHSATMVNLGVYLMARFDEALGGIGWWVSSLTVIGSATAIWGAVQTLRERDLKRILAWSTVSALGALTLLIGLPNELGALAFVSLVLAHALYKAPLFFIAGNVDHAVGTRIIDDLRGLRATLPLTAAAAAIAGLSMAGLPSTIGFIAKDVGKAAKELSGVTWFVDGSSLIASAVGIAVASVVAGRVFFGRAKAPLPSGAGLEPLRLVLPPLLLATAGLALGVFPSWISPLLFEAAYVIAPTLERADASIDAQWLLRAEGWLLILGVGAAIYAGWDRLQRFIERLRFLDRIGPASAYEHGLAAIRWIAGAVTRTFQSGRLSRYVAITAGAALVLVMPWAIDLALELPQTDTRGRPGLLLGAVVVVLGAVLAVTPGDTLQRLLGAGLVGFGSAIVFLFGGAPDLAMTQLLVETVFVVVAAVALLRYRELPRSVEKRALRALIATAFGLVLGSLLLAVVSAPLNDEMARYFLNNSVPAAHGRNVVNVIIVDFRALDTLGEIAVVMLAAAAAWPLMRRLRQQGIEDRRRESSVVVEHITSVLYWILLASSVWLLLRGHNAPGGGFIAALVATAATSAYAFAFGVDAARGRLPMPPLMLSAAGLALAVASGMPALVAGEPFLTHLWHEVAIAGTAIKLSTVLIFDLGVMLCVWGALGGFCLRLLGGRR